jgi:hypothetical protein
VCIRNTVSILTEKGTLYYSGNLQEDVAGTTVCLSQSPCRVAKCSNINYLGFYFLCSARTHHYTRFYVLCVCPVQPVHLAFALVDDFSLGSCDVLRISGRRRTFCLSYCIVDSPGPGLFKSYKASDRTSFRLKYILYIETEN